MEAEVDELTSPEVPAALLGESQLGTSVGDRQPAAIEACESLEGRQEVLAGRDSQQRALGCEFPFHFEHRDAGLRQHALSLDEQVCLELRSGARIPQAGRMGPILRELRDHAVEHRRPSAPSAARPRSSVSSDERVPGASDERVPCSSDERVFGLGAMQAPDRTGPFE